VQPAAGGSARHVSETILRNVLVVGIDQSFTDGRKDDKAGLAVPRTATLEVTPKQAESITVAADLGVLSLSLRSLGANDGATGPTGVTKTWDTEVTQIAVAKPAPAASAQPAAAPAARGFVVDVIRGSADTPVTLPEGSSRGQ
jgi:pilus assembly protein CpaB